MQQLLLILQKASKKQIYELNYLLVRNYFGHHSFQYYLFFVYLLIYKNSSTRKYRKHFIFHIKKVNIYIGAVRLSSNTIKINYFLQLWNCIWWSCKLLHNNLRLFIVSVQFPFTVCKGQLDNSRQKLNVGVVSWFAKRLQA